MTGKWAVGSRQRAVEELAVQASVKTLRAADRACTTDPVSAPSSLPTAHCLLPTAYRPLPTANCLLPTRRRSRRGISLLEVLISMFVLLFGLMGVAAIFPVGNHYAGRAEQYDRSAALIDQAFAEIKARGMLNPTTWLYAAPPEPANELATSTTWHVLQPDGGISPGWFNLHPLSSYGPGHVFIIDPLGGADATHYRFPLTAVQKTPANWRDATALRPKLYGDEWPIRRVTFAQPDGTKVTEQIAETVMRMHDDLASELPDEDDRPGMQLLALDNAGLPLARQFAGNYSWFATVVPKTPNPSASTPEGLPSSMQTFSPLYSTAEYDVSVAVVYKRDTTQESVIDAQLVSPNELVIFGTLNAVDQAVADLRPGQWISLAGVHPTASSTPPPPTPSGVFLLKWYRILSLDDETITDDPLAPQPYRRMTVDGPEWPENPVPPATANYPIDNLRAIITPGVIAVSTQTLPLEGN